MKLKTLYKSCVEYADILLLCTRQTYTDTRSHIDLRSNSVLSFTLWRHTTRTLHVPLCLKFVSDDSDTSIHSKVT
jgi:hypothetical protein